MLFVIERESKMHISSPVASGRSGFTLVELAVVLTVIGLLIGGVLKGAEAIRNAKVTLTMQQMRSYEPAIASFVSTYGFLPGDIPNPGEVIANCTGANNCLPAGNANGWIDTANEQTTWVNQLAILELAKRTFSSGLISQYSIQAYPSIYPVAASADFIGHILRGDKLLTTKEMDLIDRKFDDGLPHRGVLRAPAATTCIASTSTYDSNISGKVCTLEYQLQY